MIGVTSVELGPEEEELVLRVMRSGQLAQGPMVTRLEEAFTRVVGTTHAVAVSSGTTALVAALEALGLEPGDEVVTSPFTFVATLNAALEAGAVVRFADIRLDDFTLDVDALEATVGDRCRVVLPVHLYGQGADVIGTLRVARRVGSALLEDAAQALGATVEGRGVGSFGIGTFSLYATKNVTTGEGGVITTDDDAFADRLRLLRNQGMRRQYRYDVPGHNYRLTDLQAAIGIPQMERLDTIVKRRQENALRLTEGLLDVPGLVTPIVQPGRTHVFHQYTIRLTEDAALGRDDFVAELAARGVGSGVYYPRVVFDYDCYRDHPAVVAAEVPMARTAARQVVSLPVHPNLGADQLDQVVHAVREVLRA